MKSIDHLIKQYQLLTDWYISVLEGISETDGKKIIFDKANSLEWIARHLITGRYRNIVRIGQKVEPYNYLDSFINQTLPPPNAVAFHQDIAYPSLAESLDQWAKYSKILLDGLAGVDEKILATEMPFSVPTGGKTIHDALIFVSLHDSFHIGQMSILRKSLGYPAMQLSPQTK